MYDWLAMKMILKMVFQSDFVGSVQKRSARPSEAVSSALTLCSIPKYRDIYTTRYMNCDLKEMPDALCSAAD